MYSIFLLCFFKYILVFIWAKVDARGDNVGHKLDQKLELFLPISVTVHPAVHIPRFRCVLIMTET